MARKRLADPRTAFNIRLSPEERAELKAKAGAAGMSRAELIRHALVAAQVVSRADAQRRNFLLAAIGNNLNQLARYANNHRDDAEMLVLTEYLRRIDHQVCSAFHLPSASLFASRVQP